jgi:hypothetical protein
MHAKLHSNHILTHILNNVLNPGIATSIYIGELEKYTFLPLSASACVITIPKKAYSEPVPDNRLK